MRIKAKDVKVGMSVVIQGIRGVVREIHKYYPLYGNRERIYITMANGVKIKMLPESRLNTCSYAGKPATMPRLETERKVRRRDLLKTSEHRKLFEYIEKQYALYKSPEYLEVLFLKLRLYELDNRYPQPTIDQSTQKSILVNEGH
jgi:hypothetical protein